MEKDILDLINKWQLEWEIMQLLIDSKLKDNKIKEAMTFQSLSLDLKKRIQALYEILNKHGN